MHSVVLSLISPTLRETYKTCHSVGITETEKLYTKYFKVFEVLRVYTFSAFIYLVCIIH